jgi:peptide/nickel transport system substrate-binding protein
LLAAATVALPALAQKQGGTLRIYHRDNAPSGSIHEEATISTVQPFMGVFNNLVVYDQTKPINSPETIVPDLAESWAWDATNTKLTFKLRQGVKWHDGKPFTAKDVQCTWNKLTGKDPDDFRKNPRAIWWHNLKEVTVNGDNEATFVLNRPQPSFLSLFASGYTPVYPCHVSTKDMRTNPIGTGPFKFVEWVKDDHITLERWDRYFRPGRPYLDRIVFQSPADDTVRLTGLQTGRYNWIQTVPPQRIPELERLTREMKSSPGRPYFPFYLMLNASRPPFNDKRLRQAIAWAIDRSEIVKLVYFDTHVVTAEPTPEPSPWATGVNAHKGGPDLARAKQLLVDAGKGSGLNLTYLVKSQVPVLVKTGEILREQLKKVGITLDVRPLESGQYFEELVGKKFDIAGGYWSVTVDPDMFYYPMQHSSSAWNFCGFKSEEADRRLDAFRFTANPAARKKMYPELVRWFQEEGSLVVFSNELQRYWMKPNVQGSAPLSSLELRFEDTWLV